jgi:hypothetical protein
MNMLGSRDFIRSSDSSHSAGRSRITIFVLFTGVRKTLDALWSAGRLARDLDAHIEIIVPEIVPYPLPLDEPPVLRSFWKHRYRTIVEQAGIDTSRWQYSGRSLVGRSRWRTAPEDWIDTAYLKNSNRDGACTLQER